MTKESISLSGLSYILPKSVPKYQGKVTLSHPPQPLGVHDPKEKTPAESERGTSSQSEFKDTVFP